MGKVELVSFRERLEIQISVGSIHLSLSNITLGQGRVLSLKFTVDNG